MVFSVAFNQIDSRVVVCELLYLRTGTRCAQKCHGYGLSRCDYCVYFCLFSDEAAIISGTKLAKQVLKEVQRDVESWISCGNKRPHLTVILVGDNPASHIYVRNKVKAAAAVGISSEVILKPKYISQEELLDMTLKLNKDSAVSGVLVQLPLPDHIDERTVCNAIAPEKDVDGFHIINIGRLCLDQPSVIPATAAAVWEIIKRTGIQTFGKNIVVAGRSKNVGMPISMLLHTDGEHERPGGDATVTIAHRHTPKEQLKIHTQLADIVIVAAGNVVSTTKKQCLKPKKKSLESIGGTTWYFMYFTK
ncbi:probable bifunctional methylenetetrahydrofolate dehydrogenase/cyclohydrolase 2 [Meleagris gallopavo]|nr:probable bifunctional methylenetetrahydrofolate dehydrogenase/cyclohydrolase 2 [Meleagris gallopavo]